MHFHNSFRLTIYEDIEKVELRKRLEQAILEVERIEAETAKQISELNADNLRYLEEKQCEIKELEGKIKLFEGNIDSINKLRARFNSVRTPIIDLIGQGKNIFRKFSELDESVQDFSFPPIEVKTLKPRNGSSSPQSVYYMKWQSSDYSWENLNLPSEPSTVGRKLLGLLVQQGNLPRPNVEDFTPRSGFASCMVLRFEYPGVVVYCRDEDYREGEVWTLEEQAAFEEKVVHEQNNGLRVLRFSSQEIMGNPAVVLNKITAALISRIELEDEE